MLSKKLLSTSASVAPTYIEDVFSTWLYTGNGSTQTITNGIDLSGDGGLVWIKPRSAGGSHFLFDTVRGATKSLITNTTVQQVTLSTSLTAFNANGFSLGADANVNTNATAYASWSFRQAPRFFDVVTFTAAGGTNQRILHNLDCEPGLIILKNVSRNDSSGWYVYHRSMGRSSYATLNTPSAFNPFTNFWGTSDPTSTDFGIYASYFLYTNDTYVAYLFAHDPLGPSGDGSDGLIACGTYTGNGSNNGPEITLGWEPQWVLVKDTAVATYGWFLFDAMRGLTAGTSAGVDPRLLAESSDAEVTNAIDICPTATGFRLESFTSPLNTSGRTYTYIAIRRGPMREPTVGTEVFTSVTRTGTGAVGAVSTGFPVDAVLSMARTGSTRAFPIYDRLRGATVALMTSRLPADVTRGGVSGFATMSGYTVDEESSTSTTASLANKGTVPYVQYSFRRSPGFFDIVCYTGTGSASSISHSLTVPPELILLKTVSPTNSNNWAVYYGNSTSYLSLNLDTSAASDATYWGNTSPTASTFRVGSAAATNISGSLHVAYLFASLPGISKVGTYTGNGSSQTINCGFTTGARFILIKRTDSAGDWYVWDTARGIVAGNDPRLSLNTTAAEITTDDTIDPDSTGFIVNQVAATNVNVNAASYIYLAIA